MSEQQTQQADDPSGPGWRDVEVGEVLQSDDMLSDGTRWSHTDAAGTPCAWQDVYRRRIEPQQQPQPQQTPDDPSGDGWRDVGPDKILQEGDVQPLSDSERCQMLKIETLSDMVQQFIADRDEHKRKVANMEDRQELTRRFAVAIMSTGWAVNYHDGQVWAIAAGLTAAEPQIQRENEQ